MLRDIREVGIRVTEVIWSAGRVEVIGHSIQSKDVERIFARRAVITLPLGVLQASPGSAGTVTFRPVPEKTFKSLRALRFGQVMRLVVRFTNAWWEEDERLADAGFWLSREGVFPTWWTTLPVRSTLLVGWSSGPHCDELLGRSQEEIVMSAIADLARITGVGETRLRQMIEAVYFHDWFTDSFARGAYSYVPVGALPDREEFAKPVNDTLFFAGEATEMHGHGATVHGAIASGKRVAEQVLQSLTAHASREPS